VADRPVAVPDRLVAVAYSGGRDSTALLHATLGAAAACGAQVLALHVHHGLSPNADAWLAHCEARCARWRQRGLPVTLVAHRLTDRPARGDSIEAWARQARYRALATMAKAAGAELVLLAHHRQDQAETLLLQALRGAGLAGLSGMPRTVERDGIVWHRPWLERPRAQIEAYLRRHRLTHVDDDSNADPRFARNRLRAHVWPALVSAFPQSEQALAATGAWVQEAHAALGELAAGDVQRITEGDALRLDRWQELSPARRSLALRAWIRARQGAAAPATMIARLLAEWPGRRSGRWPCGDAELRVHRGIARYQPQAPMTRSTTDGDPAGKQDAVTDLAPRETRAGMRRAGRYPLPGWGGTLVATPVRSAGVPLAWLGTLELRPRGGAERFQAGIGRPPRALKKQYQQAGVAAWERDGPLVYSGGQLVFVPGLGLDARVIGLPGQRLVALHWERGSHAG
jgi:tRNA(Ile)-lysidine synthase